MIEAETTENPFHLYIGSSDLKSRKNLYKLAVIETGTDKKLSGNNSAYKKYHSRYITELVGELLIEKHRDGREIGILLFLIY